MAILQEAVERSRHVMVVLAVLDLNHNHPVSGIPYRDEQQSEEEVGPHREMPRTLVVLEVLGQVSSEGEQHDEVEDDEARQKQQLVVVAIQPVPDHAHHQAVQLAKDQHVVHTPIGHALNQVEDLEYQHDVRIVSCHEHVRQERSKGVEDGAYECY